MELEKYQAVTQIAPSAEVSSKYAFVPTTKVIDVLKSDGWEPHTVQEKSVRIENRQGFQKHIIRFRHPSIAPVNVASNHGYVAEDVIFPEIVVTNSHDRSSAFSIMAGLFRLVCTNGLVVSDGMFATHKVKHMGYTDDAIHQAIAHIVESVPRITGRIADFQIPVVREEQEIFAESALIAKYGTEHDVTKLFSISALLRPNRRQDVSQTAWGTFNTVQEKLVERGGRFKFNQREDARYSLCKARGTKSIDENIRLNKALWLLTERMVELKTTTV